MTGQKRSMSLNCSKNHQKASHLELGVSVSTSCRHLPVFLVFFFFRMVEVLFRVCCFFGMFDMSRFLQKISGQFFPQKFVVGRRSFPVGKFYFQGLATV